MADDLVQRARAAAETSIEPHAKHMFPQGTRHHVYGSEMRELLHALADALARKDAEIDELVRALKLCTQRAERAEARVREAPTMIASIDWTDFDGEVYWENEIRLPAEYDGKRVALVLLDTEEAK